MKERNIKLVLLTIDRAGEILIEHLIGVLPDNISIELVITRETRPYDFNGNPVINACNKANLNFIQPDFKKNDYLKTVQKVDPDLIIICNFHKIITKEVINLPKIGTFNLHSSLLPKLRGGTSVIWSLKNDLKQTGVTLHYVTEGVDDGDIIAQKKVNINFWDTQGTLYEKITLAKFEVLINFLRNIQRGNKIISTPQNHEEATYLPKRKDSDGIINLNKDMRTIYNHIRSFDPWTGAYIEINNTKIRLRRVIPVKQYMKSRSDVSYLIIGKKCNSGIQSLIINSVTDIIERPDAFNKDLAKEALRYWQKNIENE